MNFRLIYQHYANKHVSSEDYFRDITSKIGSEYPHSVSDVRVIYMPIEFSDLENAKSKGLQIINKETPKGEIPHYIIREIIVTFNGIDVNFEQDVAHLIEQFGEKAFKWILSQEGLLPYVKH